MADLDDLARAAQTAHSPQSPPLPYASPVAAQRAAMPRRRKWWLFPVLMAGWSALMLLLFIAISAAGVAGANAPSASPQTPIEQYEKVIQDANDAQHPNDVAAAKATGEGLFVLGGAFCLGSFWFLGMIGMGIMWAIYAIRK